MLDMHSRPSDLIGIKDEYTAFCFDEVCAYIISEINNGKEPIVGDKETSNSKEYTRPSDVYKKYSK